MEDLDVISLDEGYEEPDLDDNRFIRKRVKISRELTDEEKAFFERGDTYSKKVSFNKPVKFVSEPKDKNHLVGYSELKHYIEFAVLRNPQTNSEKEELDSQIKSIKNALIEIKKLRKND